MFEHIQQTAPLLEALHGKLPPGRLPPSLNMTQTLTLTLGEFVTGNLPGVISQGASCLEVLCKIGRS